MTPPGDPAATPGRVIEFTRSVRARQRMYLTTDNVGDARNVSTGDIPAAQNVLAGFGVASAACGFALPDEVKARATVGRGWTWSAAGTVGEMRGSGLGEAAIVDELFAIGVAAREAWRDGPA